MYIYIYIYIYIYYLHLYIPSISLSIYMDYLFSRISAAGNNQTRIAHNLLYYTSLADDLQLFYYCLTQFFISPTLFLQQPD